MYSALYDIRSSSYQSLRGNPRLSQPLSPPVLLTPSTWGDPGQLVIMGAGELTLPETSSSGSWATGTKPAIAGLLCDPPSLPLPLGHVGPMVSTFPTSQVARSQTFAGGSHCSKKGH